MKIITDYEILRQISEDYNPEIHDLNKIVQDLKDMTRIAWTEGYGMSAIQIGILVKIAWFKFEGKEEILINPKINYRKHKRSDIEGCLSLPHIEMPVTRSKIIHYISNGKEKKAKGLRARIIQHEIDHMNGILIIDKEANQ